jgi:hypothetical protein
MTLWMLTPVSEGRVAIRIRHHEDRARRVVLDNSDADEVREEWRCSRCGGWFPREAVSLVRTGRVVAGVPEILAYCAPCHDPSSVRGGPWYRSSRSGLLGLDEWNEERAGQRGLRPHRCRHMRRARDAHDLAILNARAERLDQETDDLLGIQADPFQ